MTMSDIKAKLIALVDNYTDPLSVKDIHKADFAEKFIDHLLASSPIQELWNEAYDLGVDFALHNHFGLSWEDAAGLRKEIKSLQEATRWIPVSERLPELERTVLVIDRVTGEITTAHLNDFNSFVFRDGRGHGASYWMPLPKPPKED